LSAPRRRAQAADKPGETKKAEAKKDEPKKEEFKKDAADPKKVDPKKDDTKKADPKKATEEVKKAAEAKAGGKKEEKAAPPVSNGFLKKLEVPINMLYMILGLPMCFLGYKYLKPSVVVVGTLGGHLVAMTIINIFWSTWVSHGNGVVTSVVLGCFLVGLGLGVALWFIPKFGQAVTGIVVGAIFGMQVYGVTCAVKGSFGPMYMLGLLQLVFLVAGFFLGALLRTYFFMLATAYLGAF